MFVSILRYIVYLILVAWGESHDGFYSSGNAWRDITDAAEFGDLDILHPAKEQASLSTQPTVRRMIRKLSKFTDEDYLLLAGDPAGIAIAAALAAQNNMGRFKVLKWDRLEKRYYPLDVNLKS